MADGHIFKKSLSVPKTFHKMVAHQLMVGIKLRKGRSI